MSSDLKGKILEALGVMLKQEAVNKDIFKVRAYKKLIEELKSSPLPITSLQDVVTIVPKISEKMKLKIKEIIETGGLAAAEQAKKDLQLNSYDELGAIYGVGPVKAKELIAKGIKSVAQLREAVMMDPTLLNDKQKIGLKYYEDILKRIPRAEMVQHEKLLLGALVAGMRGTVVGSFRRGLESSGDVDVLITMEGLTDKQRTAAFHEYVGVLKSSGYMVEVLSEGGQKFLSVVRLPGASVCRRLDLLVIPAEQFPYALLYFTGSGEFNVAFRKHALSLGYTLNEHEMKPTGKMEVAAVPPMNKEEDIFAFLGLQYMAPRDRVGANAVIVAAAAGPGPGPAPAPAAGPVEAVPGETVPGEAVIKGTRKEKVVKEKKEKVVKEKKEKVVKEKVVKPVKEKKARTKKARNA